MPLLAAVLLLAPAGDFPERMPGMIEACLTQAAANGRVTSDKAGAKYLCNGEPAEGMWRFLEAARVESWEQDTPEEGRWLSRAFPLGGCFKRIRTPADEPTDRGLSCSIWVPLPPAAAAAAPTPRD